MNPESPLKANRPSGHTIGWLDFVAAALIFMAGATCSAYLSELWPKVLLEPRSEVANVWFHSDASRVLADMTDRWADHYRSKVHPLFVMATNPIGVLLVKLGYTAWTAGRILMALAGGLCWALSWLLLRKIAVARVDAALAVCLIAASGSWICWAGVPESFVFGAISLLLALTIAALASSRAVSMEWHVAGVAVSMSMTITNVAAGVASALAHLPARRALRVCADALLLVVLLWSVQKWVYPGVQFFLGDREEAAYALMADSAPAWGRWVLMLAHSFWLPTPDWVPNAGSSNWPRLTIEHAGWPTSQALIPLGVWLLLLGSGVLSLWRRAELGRWRIVFGLTLAAQIVLHTVYGDETFLYSMHWIPLLAILAALGIGRRFRLWTRLAVLGLVVVTAHHNVRVFLDLTKQLEARSTSEVTRP